MNLIIRETDYAVRALVYIGKQEDRLVSVSEIQKETELPKSFLRKILQILQKEKVLKSSKGATGGFMLAKQSDKIFITDIIKIFQGDVNIAKCLFKQKICPNRKKCFLRCKLKNIEEYILNKFKNTTLKSLINYKGE